MCIRDRLGAEAVGGCADQALSCGVAIELFQSAALIHDDIADASELRRGEPCLYRTEGLGLAINAGDLALTRVFEIVLADGSLPAERRPVSYTHLDVYKRQRRCTPPSPSRMSPP